MRTSEERVLELHQRMDALRNRKNLQRARWESAAAWAGGLAIVIALAFVMAGVSVQNPDALPSGMSASIFTGHAALGYVVIAVLAFCLGAFVTVLCFRLRKHREDPGDDRNR